MVGGRVRWLAGLCVAVFLGSVGCPDGEEDDDAAVDDDAGDDTAADDDASDDDNAGDDTIGDDDTTEPWDWERLARGLVALPRDEGAVYLSWRLFRHEPPTTAFDVLRDGATIAAAVDGLNFLDEDAAAGQTYTYQVVPVVHGVSGEPSETVEVLAAVDGVDHLSIPLQTSGGVADLVVGDLDGDGRFDFVVRSPSLVETTTYGIDGYLHDGTWLWSFDLGTVNDPIDEGAIWTNSYTVWDLDGDFRAEVIAKARVDDEDRLVVLDGLDGSQIDSMPWPEHPVWEDNWQWTADEERHVMAIAYLDGVSPAVVLQVGTYAHGGNPPDVLGRVKLEAYDPGLDPLWQEQGLGDGVAGHGMFVLDFDGDGDDELLQGSNLIDGDGTLLWTAMLGHVDKMIPGDIDPDRPGLELSLATEPFGSWMHDDEAGIYLVDMADGSIIWEVLGLTHAHSDGWTADVTTNWPGWEIWTHDKPNGEEDEPYLVNAQGEVVSHQTLHNRPPIWWDDDDQWELIKQSGSWKVVEYPDSSVITVDGDALAVVGDVLGDFRDDLIMSEDDQLLIYVNTDTTTRKLPTPLQDRFYRLSLSRTATGYYGNVQLLDPTDYYEGWE